MEHDIFESHQGIHQKLDLLIEKVYAKEIAEQKQKEQEEKNNQTLPTTPQDQGYDADGTPTLKANPEEWKPEPYDDGIIDEEQETQEFEKFKQQADQEAQQQKTKTPPNVPEAKILPPKRTRKNIFKTED